MVMAPGLNRGIHGGWPAVDIAGIAREFIEVNQQRRELERQEEYLKGLLVEHFRTARTSWIETEKGKVGYVEFERVDYDIDMLRKALPQAIFDLVTKVSINDVVLMQLVRDGKVDPRDIEPARRTSLIRRIVVARTLW